MSGCCSADARVCVRHYEATASAVGHARRHAGALARQWGLGEAAEAVELVVSELVTNGVQAGAAPGGDGGAGREVVAVRLAAAGGSLLVEVWDRGETLPVLAGRDLDAEGGRGLVLVAACAERWSCYRPRSGGKVVWAELR